MVWCNYEYAWGGRYTHFYKEQSLNGCAILEHELQPIRFQGQFFDTETSLHYNRFRYYDTDVGMFIQRDPIGLLGGNNVFAYAPNPVHWVDVLGLIKLYRGMKDVLGVPLPEPTARGLGARPEIDIDIDSLGKVYPNTGGMSVAPNNPGNLPTHRRPSTLGGTGKDCVFEIDTEDLPEGLVYIQDKPTHGTIQPANPMSFVDYQKLLASTALKWNKKC